MIRAFSYPKLSDTQQKACAEWEGFLMTVTQTENLPLTSVSCSWWENSGQWQGEVQKQRNFRHRMYVLLTLFALKASIFQETQRLCILLLNWLLPHQFAVGLCFASFFHFLLCVLSDVFCWRWTVHARVLKGWWLFLVKQVNCSADRELCTARISAKIKSKSCL